jgi:predicted dehydrogenase
MAGLRLRLPLAEWVRSELMAEIRLGVIGYGIRSNVLIGACSVFDNIRITALADTSAAARDKALADHGAEVFESYIEMLDSGKVNAVLVETPPATHAECVIEALNRGIHVLCDVPACHDISEVQPLWDAAQKSKAVYSFEASTNFWGFVDACVDLKANGMLGDPFYLEAEYVADLGDYPKLTPWRKGYEPIRYCTHSLGPIMKWIDEDLSEVSCFDTGSHVHNDPVEHDAMVAIFKTKKDVVVKFLASFINNCPSAYHRYVCFGTKGYFEKMQPLPDGTAPAIFSTKAVYGLHGMVPLPVAESRPELADMAGVGEHGGVDYVMIKDFVDAIAGKKAPFVGMREALRMTVPGLYALASANAGGALTKIRYPWDS